MDWQVEYGRTSVTDAEQLGQLSKSTTDYNDEWVSICHHSEQQKVDY